MKMEMIKAAIALAFLGSTLYSLHRGWQNAAGWLGFLTFLALIAALHPEG